MSIAERTREAARRHPFLVAALRADVVNFTAAARYLDIGETEAVAAALRRLAADVSPETRDSREFRIRMLTGVGEVDGDEDADAFLRVQDRRFAREAGDLTAVVVRGDVDPGFLAALWGRIGIDDVAVHAAGIDDGALVAIVPRTAGPDLVRILEEIEAPRREDDAGRE